jgi:hypothetical protein
MMGADAAESAAMSGNNDTRAAACRKEKRRNHMKSVLIALTFVLAGSVGLGCGKSKDKAGKGASGDVWTGMDGEMTSKLVVKGLDDSGLKGLTMRVPKNAKVTAAMRISKSDPAVAQISNDMGFTMWLSQGKVDIAQQQGKIEKSSFKKFLGWVSKKPDALIYKAKGLTGDPEFHFLVALKVGGKDYKCRNATSASFRAKKDVTQMLTACRTLKAK